MIGFIVYSLKKPYKVWLIIVFVDMNSPNPLFYRCKCLPYQKQDTFLDLYEKTRVKMKQLLRSAAGCPQNRFTLCVCFCVFPSLNLNENPIRSETSVREQSVKSRKQGNQRKNNQSSKQANNQTNHQTNK